MRFPSTLFAFLLAASVSARAQPLDNASLAGAYRFVYLAVQANVAGDADDAVDLLGTITFDGAGGYAFDGRSGRGAGAATAAGGGGRYAVFSNGFVAIDNPFDPALTINARLGQNAEALIGVSTEATDGTQDVFVAVEAPPAGSNLTPATLNGPYIGSSLWLPGGRDDAVRTAFLRMTLDGAGGFTRFTLDGHATDRDDVMESLEAPGATYTLAADGSGTFNAPSTSTLLPAARSIFASADGRYLLGFSEAPGERDVFLAVRRAAGPTSDASFNGTFWFVDLLTDRQERFYEAAVGAVRANGAGSATLSQRLNGTFGPLDFSGLNAYGLGAEGVGFLRGAADPSVANFGVGANNVSAFVGAEVDQGVAAFTFHGVTFGIRVPSFTAPAGPFAQPLGVVNAASFAPATNPVAGGVIVSLFGSALSAGQAQAGAVPLPKNLAGATATVNGIPAPLFFVSPGQFNLQIPFEAGGVFAEITVSTGGATSNTVEVPLAPTSPGVFSLDENGIGPGAIQDTATGAIIGAARRARRGDIVAIFATGLGAVNPPIASGAAAGLDVFHFAADPNVQVSFSSATVVPVRGDILFAGLAPGFVGLNQINVRIPDDAPSGDAVFLALETSDAFTDFVDIAIDEATGLFTCGQKTTCAQMDSCAEAQFHLNECRLTALDADNDGIPCESICGQ